MAAKRSTTDRLEFKNLDALFGLDQEQTGQVLDVPTKELFPFQNHPFKVLDDEKMDLIVESVRESGILVPIMVRNREAGGYEIVSGHRRKHAADIVGLERVPVVIRDLTDDEAVIAMVDSNLQREEILPSEKAFAYKMKLEALNHQGARTDLGSSQIGTKSKNEITLSQVGTKSQPETTSSQIGTKLRTDQQMAEELGISRNQIQRYIRLTELLPELLDMVDKKKLKLNPAVELSYIPADEQSLLLEVMQEDEVKPSLYQAQQIKKLSQEGNCTKEALHALLKVAGIKERNVTIRHEVIMQYFSADTSDAEIESLICRLLEEHRRKHGGV